MSSFFSTFLSLLSIVLLLFLVVFLKSFSGFDPSLLSSFASTFGGVLYPSLAAPLGVDVPRDGEPPIDGFLVGGDPLREVGLAVSGDALRE